MTTLLLMVLAFWMGFKVPVRWHHEKPSWLVQWASDRLYRRFGTSWQTGTSPDRIECFCFNLYWVYLCINRWPIHRYTPSIFENVEPADPVEAGQRRFFRLTMADTGYDGWMWNRAKRSVIIIFRKHRKISKALTEAPHWEHPRDDSPIPADYIRIRGLLK